MLWVLLVVFIVLFAVSCYFADGSFSGFEFCAIFIFFAILACIGGIIGCSIFIINGRTLDDKIKMYSDENRGIESQIDEVVTEYMKHESETFKDLKVESSITLVSMYPELKSDKLIKKQIDVYTKNNEKIKELKNEKINVRIYKWWLYFGK